MGLTFSTFCTGAGECDGSERACQCIILLFTRPKTNDEAEKLAMKACEEDFGGGVLKHKGNLSQLRYVFESSALHSFPNTFSLTSTTT
jgi:hypothetical protein